MSSILVTPSVLRRVSYHKVWTTYKFLSCTCAACCMEKPFSVDFPAWRRERATHAVWFFPFPSLLTMMSNTTLICCIKFLIKEWPYQTQSTECLEKKNKALQYSNDNNCIEQPFKNMTRSDLKTRLTGQNQSSTPLSPISAHWRYVTLNENNLYFDIDSKLMWDRVMHLHRKQSLCKGPIKDQDSRSAPAPEQAVFSLLRCPWAKHWLCCRFICAALHHAELWPLCEELHA